MVVLLLLLLPSILLLRLMLHLSEHSHLLMLSPVYCCWQATIEIQICSLRISPGTFLFFAFYRPKSQGQQDFRIIIGSYSMTRVGFAFGVVGSGTAGQRLVF